jgi:hypothetical protein
VEHRLSLGRIEVGEEHLVGRHGHASMLAAPSGVVPDVSPAGPTS